MPFQHFPRVPGTNWYSSDHLHGTPRRDSQLHASDPEQDDIRDEDRTKKVRILARFERDSGADEEKQHDLHGVQYATLSLESHGCHTGLP